MSHHYSEIEWFYHFVTQLYKRLPSNYRVLHRGMSSSLVWMELGRFEGKKLRPYRGRYTKPVCWTTCSPYRAADILLYAFLKEAAKK